MNIFKFFKSVIKCFIDSWNYCPGGIIDGPINWHRLRKEEDEKFEKEHGYKITEAYRR